MEGVLFKDRDKSRGTRAPHTSRVIDKSGREEPVKSQDTLSLLRDQVGTCPLSFRLG